MTRLDSDTPRSYIDETIVVMQELDKGGKGKFEIDDGRLVPYYKPKGKKRKYRRFRSKIWRIMNRNHWVQIVKREGHIHHFRLSATGSAVARDKEVPSRVLLNSDVPTSSFSGLHDRIDFLVQTSTPRTEDEMWLATYGLERRVIDNWRNKHISPDLYELIQLAAAHGTDLNYLIRGVKPMRVHKLLRLIPPPRDQWFLKLRRRWIDALLEIRVRNSIGRDAHIAWFTQIFNPNSDSRARKLLRGKTEPFVSEVLTLCNYLNLDAHHFLTGVDLSKEDKDFVA